jgi:hypothetical protein
MRAKRRGPRGRERARRDRSSGTAVVDGVEVGAASAAAEVTVEGEEVAVAAEVAVVVGDATVKQVHRSKPADGQT